jgi:quercetin dioxygenase-like cupin family protein
MSAPRYAVASLRGDVPSVGAAVLADVFLAPWRNVELVTLVAGEELGPRTLDDSEAMVYITAGTGEAQLSSGTVALRAGVSLTLFKDELLHVQAGDGPLELFIAEMGVRSA